MSWEDVASFLVGHSDLIGLVYDAINKGLSKDQLMAAIKREMVEASDAAVKAQLGLPIT